MINFCASCLWHPPTHKFCCLSYYPCTQKGGLDTWKCITLSEVSVWIITKAAFNVQGGNQAEPLIQFYSVRDFWLDIGPLEWSRGVTGYNVFIFAIEYIVSQSQNHNHWHRTFAISYHYHHLTRLWLTGKVQWQFYTYYCSCQLVHIGRWNIHGYKT